MVERHKRNLFTLLNTYIRSTYQRAIALVAIRNNKQLTSLIARPMKLSETPPQQSLEFDEHTTSEEFLT
ncbi:MAG: hypothetical protein QNJ72_09515 [Pleurocapsa sp. MO_226.B13]|nr:hypothetical protein [Pleurocapsa sp. MO_226.B13]